MQRFKPVYSIVFNRALPAPDFKYFSFILAAGLSGKVSL